MGFWSTLLKQVGSELLSQENEPKVHAPQRHYSPEEYVIYEQEQSGESWHGVPLSELSKLAQETYRGRYVKVDQYNFLVFHYASNSRKTKFHVQCELDENGKIRRTLHNYYPGQWRDSADDFVEKANQRFTFC